MLSIVGGGNMGWALATGLLEADERDALTIVEKDPDRREVLAQWCEEYDNVTVSDSIAKCDAALIAVKPKDVEVAVVDAVNAGATRIISIAAGVTVARLHEWAGGRISVVRAMPNIGAIVASSATAICGAPTTKAADLAWAAELLSHSGLVVQVAEDQMDAVTGLSGSGPAFLFLVLEAMIDAGVNAGLPRDVADKLARATFDGVSTIATVFEDDSPAQWRASVTTPAGTTAAGVRVLEERAVRGAVIDAVAAATERSRELGAPQAPR